MNSMKDIRKIIGTAPMFMPAAGIILYQNGKILLQKRGDNGKWALHGGAMEMGETTEETAVREAREEIGITPVELDFYGVFSGKQMYHIYPDGNEVYIISTVYFCDEYSGELKVDENEVLEVKWFDIDKLPENIAPIDSFILENIHEYIEAKYK
ncbi:NUDIX hydrolase [Zhenhengia yiwuensis]|uniref:NUDIX hydrolase n=1 Tax=Zhenhengia yiwuensis TaxID=2763666 RepID=A0A926ENS9_9FIRM|nr:NUDIX hydrolase [Zhenhengia yiwuensis]MBC8581433.1 NUDIX hydrolase [Zhenhengia yiwuensis]